MAMHPPSGAMNPPTASHAPDSDSNELDSDSDSSQRTKLSYARRSPYALSPQPPSSRSPALAPVDSSAGPLPRPPPIRTVHDVSSRNNSPTQLSPAGSFLGHRPRQRSQGYFEPTLPSNSTSNTNMTGGLSASQIAAQAAMHVQPGQHNRKRSTTIPEPGGQPSGARRPAVSPPPVPSIPQALTAANAGMSYQNGSVGGNRVAAASAANAAFPRSPLISPGNTSQGADYISGGVEKEQKKSKMKLFSKPKSIATSREKDFDRKHPPLPSPGKMAMQSTSTLNRMIMNNSTTSLVDPTMSSASSIYSSNNASTSTLVPTDRGTGTYTPAPEKEKEKHKHHFLSRQKNKLRDKDDHYGLSLSSANSTSKPTDPNAPQPLYSFAAPVSPGHSSSFAQTVSGLDLRHGGRALRQKKKEEKAAAMASYIPEHGHDLPPFRERNQSFSTMDRSDWAGLQSSSGPLTASSTGGGVVTPGAPFMGDMAGIGATFGLPALAPDDAWPLLKARLLNIFEGEDPRPPVEDFNGLLSIHIRSCIQKRVPTVLIEDLTDLLQTGFRSLDQTLRSVPDDRLIPALVDMWLVVFTTILPFLQAVFLPLDLEFKGRGPLMTAREAADFWGAAMPGEEQVFGAAISTTGETAQASTAGRPSEDWLPANSNIPTLGEELSVRRITLLTFRDTVILPRTDILTSIFSRLSLENLNAGAVPDSTSSPRPSFDHLQQPPRPGTANSGSAGVDPSQGSFNSQASTLLDSTGTTSLGARSRATSNTSAGSFSSIPGRTLIQNSLNSSAQPNTPASTGGSFSHPRPSPAIPPNPGYHAPQQTSQSAYSYGYGAVAGSPFYTGGSSSQAPPPTMDSSRVTETAGRMLQCVSVLASVQSGDDSQAVMERLMRELKYNWLGRGRTGRQRRGWVGVRRPRGEAGGTGEQQQEQVAAA